MLKLTTILLITNSIVIADRSQSVSQITQASDKNFDSIFRRSHSLPAVANRGSSMAMPVSSRAKMTTHLSRRVGSASVSPSNRVQKKHNYSPPSTRTSSTYRTYSNPSIYAEPSNTSPSNQRRDILMKYLRSDNVIHIPVETRHNVEVIHVNTTQRPYEMKPIDVEVGAPPTLMLSLTEVSAGQWDVIPMERRQDKNKTAIIPFKSYFDY